MSPNTFNLSVKIGARPVFPKSMYENKYCVLIWTTQSYGNIHVKIKDRVGKKRLLETSTKLNLMQIIRI